MERMISGTQYAYYFVCQRKLWLFSNHIEFEKYNEDVKIGKVIDEMSYNRETRAINLNEDNQLDFIDNQGILHEIKKSKAISEAHIEQAKYYAYQVVQKGGMINGIEINYPELNQKETYKFDEEDIKMISKYLEAIESVITQTKVPPVIHEKFCKKCAYYDYCYI